MLGCNVRRADPAYLPNKADVASYAYAGCYQLTMGRWWPWSLGESAKYVTPPNRIELSPERGTWGFEEGELLIRAVPAVPIQRSDGVGRPRASFWKVRASDGVKLFWTDGFTGVTLKFQRRGNELVGWADPMFDAGLLIPRTVRVKARPIPCR